MPSQRHPHIPNQAIRTFIDNAHSEYSSLEENYSYSESHDGRDYNPRCRCSECQGDEYDEGDEEEETSPHDSTYDSCSNGGSLAESNIIRQSAGFRRDLPIHYTRFFNFDRDSIFGDDGDDNGDDNDDGDGGSDDDDGRDDGNDGSDGSYSGLHYLLIEAHHNYVCLWLVMRIAELRAMGFEGVDAL
jgi:hypothetical protein